MIHIGQNKLFQKKETQTLFCRVEYFSQQTHSCQLAHPGGEDGIAGFGVGNTNCTGEAEGACDDDDDDINDDDDGDDDGDGDDLD